MPVENGWPSSCSQRHTAWSFLLFSSFPAAKLRCQLNSGKGCLEDSFKVHIWVWSAGWGNPTLLSELKESLPIYHYNVYFMWLCTWWYSNKGCIIARGLQNLKSYLIHHNRKQLSSALEKPRLCHRGNVYCVSENKFQPRPAAESKIYWKEEFLKMPEHQRSLISVVLEWERKRKDTLNPKWNHLRHCC